MSQPCAVICVRLPQPLHRRLLSIHAQHFAGLRLSALVRMLMADQLLKDEDVLVRLVLARMRGGWHR